MNANMPEYFSAGLSRYMVCRAANVPNDVSFIVVEDDPGPYEELLQDVVNEGLCALAASVPFSGEAIRLLLGEDVTFGEAGEEQVNVRLPNGAHCVAILDVMNAGEGLSFPGYDESRPDLAGHQFFRQLRGFPGMAFFATRYGTAQLQAEGRGYGIVPLKKEPDDHGPLSEADVSELRKALDNALVQFDVSNINRIDHRGSVVAITFHGQVCTPPAKREVLAFMALVQSKPDGLTAQELADAVGYKPRPKTEPNLESNTDASEDSADQQPEVLLAKLLELIDLNEVNGVTLDDVYFVTTSATEANTSAEDQIRAIFGVCAQKSPGFSLDALIALLCDDDSGEKTALDHTDMEAMSVRSENADSDLLTPAERYLCKQNYIKMNFKQLPELQAEEARLQAQIYNEMADGYSGVAASADADMEQLAREKKKAVGATEDQKMKLVEIRADIKKLRAHRDDYFRRGVKSVPVKDDVGTIIGYRAPGQTATPDGAMRKLKGHMLKTLSEQCNPAPEPLIGHINAHWIRDRGTYRYTGKEDWTVVQHTDSQ